MGFTSCVRPTSADKILLAAKECAKQAGYHLDEFSTEIDMRDPKEAVVVFTGKKILPGKSLYGVCG
jgi:predicted transcriptional regulator of viral defense system